VISRGKRNRVGDKGSGGSVIRLILDARSWILDTGLNYCGFQIAECGIKRLRISDGRITYFHFSS